ncbi:MAG: molybdenum cofactor guanylyltransferase, partial [Anaerolineales bacterium]
MSHVRAPLSIAITAGGKSARMGMDKGLIPFMGKPLVMYIIDQVSELSDDVFIISNDPNYPSVKYRVLPDIFPGIGALGGIHSSLAYARQDLCLVLACDMPFIHIGLIEYLLEQTKEVDAIVPELAPEQLEPFRGIYRKTCMSAIEQCIQIGERRATSFLSQVTTKLVPRTVQEKINPTLDTFFNINT